MHPSGFFLIHIDEPGQEGASSVEVSASSGTPDAELGSQSGYNVRLRWIEGLPYITDLGSSGEILVNSTPIQPNMPIIIQAGDTIKIGNAHLTWNAEAKEEKPVREPVVAQAEIPVEPQPLPSQLEPVVAQAEIPVESQPLPSQLEPVYSLIVKTPQGTREYPITGKVIGIGRAPENDIHIDDDRVSRYHARILQHDDGYQIVDLGSVNGLVFQNTRISRRLLADGDIVWLSRSISLTCKITRPAAQAEVAPRRTAEPPQDYVAGQTVVVPKRAVEPAEAQAPDKTVALPKKAAEPPGPDASEAPAVPFERRPEPQEFQAADQTVFVPKRAAEPAEPQAPDKTVVLPKKAAEPPEPGVSEEPAVPFEKRAEPQEFPVTDQTVVVPKRAAEPAEPQAPDETVVLPKKAAQPPEPSLSEQPDVPLAKRAAFPEVRPADKTVVVSGKAVERPGADAVQETAWMDMAQRLEEDVELEYVSSTIVRNTRIPHLVIHLPTRTWEAQFTKDRMTIGRGEDNDISVPDASISRHHATVERRGSGYEIREAHSINGIWLGKQRIEEHMLRDGDILSLGRAKLVYKAGFSADDLTLIGPPRIDGQPARRPVVFVPGMMGSELWLGSERLWPNPKQIISNVEVFSLPGDPRIEARNILSDLVIVPNIVKMEQYSRLGDYLETGLEYTRGKDLLEFAYDWRQDIRLASQRLAETIEHWHAKAPITIIAHSLGTLVTRYYVEKLGGKRFVERIILMGGPHYGAPKALSSILVGPGILPFGIGAERMRHVLATFPSSYQILPIYPCVTDQDGKDIDVMQDDSWLPERQRPFLRAGRSFRSELGFRSSVPCVSIFGYGLKTMLRVKIHRRPDGQWGKVDFIEDTAGDSTVPSGSAVLKQSEIHPVFQEHGSLYVDDDVRMRLKVELTRSTTWQRR